MGMNLMPNCRIATSDRLAIRRLEMNGFMCSWKESTVNRGEFFFYAEKFNESYGFWPEHGEWIYTNGTIAKRIEAENVWKNNNV